MPNSSCIITFGGKSIMRKSASDPIGTLSIGNVVSAGVTLYKSNFQSYFFVALRSVGWIIVAMLSIIPISLIGGLLSQVIGQGLSVFLIVILWLGAFLFCLGKYAVNRAIISRMAYQQLINQPETVKDATLQLSASHWKFLRLALWLFLFMVIVVFLAYLLLLAFALVGGVLGSQIQGPIGTLLAILFVLGGVIGAILLVIRFYSSFFLSELPLAVEGRAAALESIGRSWQLSSPFISRIILVVLVAFLVTLPLTVVANLPGMAAYVGIIDQIKQASSNPEALNAAMSSGNYVGLQFISVILSLLLELFVVPFWQAIKSVIYFDLCSRREGNDLQMR
jgi:hypothetical protein